WDDYCTHLAQNVFPTPLYEIIVCIGLFFFLWSIRKKINVPGKLFGVYLFVNGLERVLIEQIRVNTKYDIFGFHPTQAEIIAVLLMLSGALLFWKSKDWFKPYTSVLKHN
ncbi:MAG: diacylglyceryl transferase, partial [Pseudopedobacter saltans]